MIFQFCLISEHFIAVTFTCKDVFIIICSDDLCIETTTISAFNFIVLIAFITKVMLTWFGNE